MGPWWGMVQRRGLGLIGLLAIALLVTSCVTVSVESEFNEDGSARHVYTATFEHEFLDDFSEGAGAEVDPEEDFAEVEEQARQAGYEVERIDTEKEIGVRLSTTVEDNQDLGQVINDFFSSGGTETDEPVTAFSGSFSESDNTYVLDLTVDGDSLFGEELGSDEVPAEMMSSFFDMTYTVRMPGEVDVEETNGRVLPDGRVQWDLPLTGSETFSAVSETEDDRTPLLLILGGSFLVVLLAVGAALLGFFLLRRRPAPAAAPGLADAPTAPWPSTHSDD